VDRAEYIVGDQTDSLKNWSDGVMGDGGLE